VDAQAAVDNDLLVYSKDVTGAVSASFGVVSVPITSRDFSATRTLVVQNTGKSVKRVSLKYDPITAQPGVSYSVWPSSVVVLPGKSVNVAVTLRADPSKLRKTIDPTMETTQLGVARQYISDSSGRVLVTPAGGSALRVPVYGAVKPVSATTTNAVTVGRGSSATSALAIQGKGFSQGTGSTAFASLLSVMQYGASSPKLKDCKGSQTTGCISMASQGAADLKYVGAGSTPSSPGSADYSDGWLYFGINTWGQWTSTGTYAVTYVDIDTTGDGTPDFEVVVQPISGTDVLAAALVDYSTGAVLDYEPVNFNWGDVDTNVFDTDTIVAPVYLGALGVTPTTTSFPITYQVGTQSSYSSGVFDQTSPVTFDVTDPAVSVSSPLFNDQGGTKIPYTLGSDATKDTKALVLHLQGAAGQRAEVVPVSGKHRPTPPGKKHWPGNWHPGKWHWGPGHHGH
jgi:hypothetical protein